MKNALSLFALAAILTSCRSEIYYQVYKTNSETVKPNNDHTITFEDARCRIDYNLWADHGDAGFSFYNKTDEVIHLLLDESFYVLNDAAYDYYQNRIFSDGDNSAITLKSGMGYGGFGYIMTFSSKTVVSNKMSSVSVVEAKNISIPPRTAKRVSEFDISQVIYRDCSLLRFPSPRKVTTKSFSVSDTPLKFYNTITYTLGENTARQNVKNDFYIAEITNYPEKEMVKMVSKEFCGEKGSKQQVFNSVAPDKFYVKYVKTNGDNWKY